MVLRGDRDLAGGVVDDRDVDAPVSELHLVGRPAERAAQDLVAEADAEHRDVLAEHPAREFDDVVGRGRVAGTVREEHPVGLEVGDGVERDGRGQHVGADAAFGEHPRRVGLDPQVDGGHREPVLVEGFDHVTAVGGDLIGQPGTLHVRLVAHAGDQFVGVGERRAGEDTGLHRPVVAEDAHHGAGVDTADPDDALTVQFLVEGGRRTPVGHSSGGVANRIPRDPDLARVTVDPGAPGAARALAVLGVPAGVADLRRRGDHDLPVVARIGQGFLIAGHRGAEHRLAKGLADCAEAPAGEHLAVLQHQDRCVHSCAPCPCGPCPLSCVPAKALTQPG